MATYEATVADLVSNAPKPKVVKTVGIAGCDPRSSGSSGVLSQRPSKERPSKELKLRPQARGVHLARASVAHGSLSLGEAADEMGRALEASYALDEIEEMADDLSAEHPDFGQELRELALKVRAGLPRRDAQNAADMVEAAITDGLDDNAENVLSTLFDLKVTGRHSIKAEGFVGIPYHRAAQECLEQAYLAETQQFLRTEGLYEALRAAVSLADLENPALDAYATEPAAVPVLMLTGLTHVGVPGNSRDLLDTYEIDPVVLGRWLQAIQQGYQANLYHNWTHAWDVFQGTHVCLCAGVGQYLADLDVLATLIASIGHDVGHPGLNNPHLVRTGHQVAITYNDVSPLENLHASTTFQLLKAEERNFLAHLNVDTYEKLRVRVIKAIMGTDMLHHFDKTAKFGSRVANADDLPFETAPFTDASLEDRLQLVEMTVHFADIGNCTRPWESYRRTCVLLEEEFFLQGDKERREALAVSPLMNREKDSLAVAQAFWIPKIVMPLVDTFLPLLGDVGEALHACAEDNQARWSVLVAKHGKLTAGQLVDHEYGERLQDFKEKRQEVIAVERMLEFLPRRHSVAAAPG